MDDQIREETRPRGGVKDPMPCYFMDAYTQREPPGEPPPGEPLLQVLRTFSAAGVEEVEPVQDDRRGGGGGGCWGQ